MWKYMLIDVVMCQALNILFDAVLRSLCLS
jgi:hypothetical protein